MISLESLQTAALKKFDEECPDPFKYGVSESREKIKSLIRYTTAEAFSAGQEDMRESKEKLHKDWWWLQENHEWATHNISILPMKVHPTLRTQVDDKEKNTYVEYWIENGPWVKDDVLGVMRSHDWRLDCGGDTFEEAIVKLAKKVKKYYGEKSDEYGHSLSPKEGGLGDKK